MNEIERIEAAGYNIEVRYYKNKQVAKYKAIFKISKEHCLISKKTSLTIHPTPFKDRKNICEYKEFIADIDCKGWIKKYINEIIAYEESRKRLKKQRKINQIKLNSHEKEYFKEEQIYYLNRNKKRYPIMKLTCILSQTIPPPNEK